MTSKLLFFNKFEQNYNCSFWFWFQNIKLLKLNVLWFWLTSIFIEQSSSYHQFIYLFFYKKTKNHKKARLLNTLLSHLSNPYNWCIDLNFNSMCDNFIHYSKWNLRSNKSNQKLRVTTSNIYTKKNRNLNLWKIKTKEIS